jgi:NRPS condensation-like uncharacterized protein
VLQGKDFDLDPCKSSPETGATFVHSSVSVASSEKKSDMRREVQNIDEDKVKLKALAGIMQAILNDTILQEILI